MSQIEQRLAALRDRRQEILQEIAVLKAREAAKAKERAEIAERLTAAGVDLTKPDVELKRLQEQANAYIESAEKHLDEIARTLMTIELADTPTITRTS